MANTRGVPSKTAQYFMNISRLMYCLSLPEIWTRDVPRSKRMQQIHKIYSNVSVLLTFVLIIFEVGAFFTQSNLTDRQASNMWLFGITHVLLFGYIADVIYYEKELRKFTYCLVVDLNSVYDDHEAEAAAVKKMKMYSGSYIGFFLIAIIFYTVDALFQVLRNGATFTAVVLAWPDVLDKSAPAGVARVAFYLVFLAFMLMLCGVYILFISMTICLTHQFKNLQSYFHNLSKIFKEDISQKDMEEKYMHNFKFGITLHLKTLWCKQQWQLVANITFSSQIVLNVIVIVLMLSQMVNSERTLFALFSTVFTLIAILCSTGLFMLNAGNITLEAEEVSQAMYQSGWENCAVDTVRARRLVLCAMMRAQKPEVLWALGVMPMSYESYVSIVKSSYTVFSVIY